MSNSSTRAQQLISKPAARANRLKSRKFWVFLLVFATATALLWFEKLDSMYYTIVIVTDTIIYLFVEGQLDVKRVAIDTAVVKISKEETPNSEPPGE